MQADMRGPLDGRAAFEALNAGAVALLGPLCDDTLRDSPQAMADALCGAIEACAAVGEAAGVRSLGYLSGLVGPYLRQRARDGAWPQVADLVEAWVADVVAFCAGQMSDAESPRIVTQTGDWPDFPAIPRQLLGLIVARLSQDARRIAGLSGGAPDAIEVESAGVESVDAGSVGVESVDAGAEGEESVDAGSAAVRPPPERREIAVPDRPAEVARDELAMLAEAAGGLDDDFGATLTEISLGRVASPGIAELADAYRERLANLANASRYVGLDALANLLDVGCESLARWHAEPQRLREPDAIDALARLPQALRGYLEAPEALNARTLAALLAHDAWPVALAHACVDAVAIALDQPSLVGSRQVEVRDTGFSEDELSLGIPADVDAAVLDNLLRELPALSTQFGDLVERLTGGGGAGEDPAPALAAAQRIAHTLKGAANTAGVRGIATLTHLLEDLLHAMQSGGEPIGGEVREIVVRASDCLAEATEAVAGIGRPPADLRAVCESLADWVARLVGDGREASPPQAVPPRPVAAQVPASATAADRGSAADSGAAADSASASAAGLGPGEDEALADASSAQGDEALRVPSKLVDRMLELAGEAAILMSQVHEQVARLSETRAAFRQDTDRLLDLSSELERLVDLRGVTLAGRRDRAGLDPLELEEFDELHTVSRRIAESGADGKVLGQLLDRQSLGLADVVAQLERVQDDLRDTAMRSRMVGVSTIAPRLRRAVRQAARMAGKQVDLAIIGEPMAVDAHLLQTLVEPLAHLLRNAVDHGIEPAEERTRLGKPVRGRIELTFAREGNALRIACRDDGAGLDLESVRDRAVEQGLLSPDAKPGDADLARMVLQAGFTTRRTASQLSGRGFGMDVVNRCVAALRGSIGIASERGAGLEVSISIPERMISIPAVVVRTPGHVLALSIRGVEGIVAGSGTVRDAAGRLRFAHGEGMLEAHRLDELLGLPEGLFAEQRRAAAVPGAQAEPDDEVVLLVRRADERLVAVVSPAPGQTRNVVVRPLPTWLPRVWAVDGATVLGDGAVAPVIDLPTLSSPEAPRVAAPQAGPVASSALPVCLVVDDSVSVRRSMQAFLADIGLSVMAAGDGVDALALAGRTRPDLAIVDLEMPRMNGLELCRALRADPLTSSLPIIMITSRYSDKHRAMALEAGADVFMTKPYTEDELASQVRRCLEPRAPLG